MTRTLLFTLFFGITLGGFGQSKEPPTIIKPAPILVGRPQGSGNDFPSLYPNPAHNHLNFTSQYKDNSISSIEIYDAIGDLYLRESFPEQGSINVSQLPIGVYIARLEYGPYSVVQTFRKA